MIPNEKKKEPNKKFPPKETGKGDKDEKEDKKKERRSSLSDGSSSTSTSSSSSNGDMDEVLSDQSHKGTMTTTPPSELEANHEECDQKQPEMLSKIFHSAQENMKSSKAQQRVVRTRTPVDPAFQIPETAEFRSISDDYPQAMPSAVPHSHRANTGDTEREDRIDKNKKKRNKKGKKEDVELQDMTGTASKGRKSGEYNVEKRELETAALRRMANGAGNDPGIFFLPERGDRSIMPHYMLSQSRFQRDRQAEESIAPSSCGIAASGYYDPRIQFEGEKQQISNMTAYSVVIPHRFEWIKEFEQKFKMEHNHISVVHEERAQLEPMLQLARKRISSMPKYLREVHSLILDGKPRKASRRILHIVKALKKGDESVKEVDDGHLFKAVVTRLIEQTVDERYGTNIVMALVSQSTQQPPCFMRRHGACLMLDLLLTCLDEETLSKVLSQECKAFAKRRAIHFACLTGQPCQLEALLKRNVCPNTFDGLDQAPIHYTIIRDHICLFRQLMWHGADLNLVNSKNALLPYDLVIGADGHQPAGLSVPVFARERLSALSRVTTRWLRTLTHGTIHQVVRPASELHIVRLIRDSDGDSLHQKQDWNPTDPNAGSRMEKMVTLKLSLRDIRDHERRGLVLFVLPVSYTAYDMEMTSELPHVVRVYLSNSERAGRPPAPLIDRTRLYVSERLKPAREPSVEGLFPFYKEEGAHNGYYYAFKMPSDLTGYEMVRAGFTLQENLLAPSLQRSVRLFVQAFICSKGE